MILPVGTDAPLYHRPIGTIGLIVLNVAAFALSFTQFGDEDWERHVLVIGDGLKPLQWITHGFLHADIFHLVGNMVFLWSFGLIIEGKVGFFAFVGTYLGIQVLTGAAIQAMLMSSDVETALGASGAIYGLIGMAMIWAPVNELSVFYLFFIGFRLLTGVKEVAIYLFALFYIAWDLIALLFTGLTLSSSLGHGTGALWGMAIGVAMVQAKLVDCDDWDVFSIRRKRRLRAKSGTGATRREWGPSNSARASSRDRRRVVSSEVPRLDPEPESRTVGAGTRQGVSLSSDARIADARRRVSHMLDQQMATAALQAHEKAMGTLSGYQLDEKDHLRLIKGLIEQGAEDEAIRPMRDYIARYPGSSHRVRLRLAQYLVDRQQRPLAAIRLLDEIPAGSFPENLKGARDRIRQKANALREEGGLEIDSND